MTTGEGDTKEKYQTVQGEIKANGNQAQQALDNAEQRQRINLTSGSNAQPKQRSILLNDQDKIIKAREAVKKHKRYSADIAKQAQDPEIRKNLLIVAKATQKREELKKEENRLSAQIAELGQLASAAAAVANNLGEIKNPSSSKASVPVTQADSKDAGVSSVAEPKASAEKAAEVTEAKVDALTQQEKIALLKELDAGKSKTGSKIKDLSLKNKLVAELRAADAAEKKMATGSSNSAVTENGKRENAAAKVVSEVLDPSLEATDGYNRGGGGKSPAFSLNTSETAAEVKRMTDEAERQLATSAQAADDIKAGILELESPSLFERVKARITGCLRQHCVISKSVAQK